ncbi:DUF3375 domain-containing protein [Glutamicibacter halophytocola]|uniref:DUF3375 domain-containing protein n=1 Tax=Glutamicibacter halophytocola TaxID=1933880 RepID=A0ABX5YCM6_9MICC|nr:MULTISPECIES: DUF3375 domain-containing protein [Glutamicibacter]MBF6672639.1 DUF3375 domain-containing protein [Glutamicibacter sp. FBE19]QDY67431.1 DUF3375 domain-containing protein [Glutamicibacter halophytocola]
MQPSHRANSLWLQAQQFKGSAAYRLLTAQPWAVAFIRAEFTADRSRVALELFHASLDSFLKQARQSDEQIPQSYSAQDFAETWVKQGILARPLIDGRFVYEPSAQTLRTLRFLSDFSTDDSHLNSSRLNTLLSSLESLVHETDPDPEARIRALESQIAQRQAQIEQLRSGDDPAVLSRTTALSATRSLLDLASSLPADFRRMRDGVQDMLHSLREGILDASTAKGVAVGQVLEADRQLRSTAEGETFSGFTEFLNSPDAQQRFRSALAEVLEREFVDDLDATERQILTNLLRELRRQAAEVHASYGKLSESLHAFVQSEDYKQAELLRQAVREAELAITKSSALKPRSGLAQMDLYTPQLITLSGLGIYDPSEHVAPPPLAQAPEFSEADIVRSPATPQANMPLLRESITRQLNHAPAGAVRMDEVFAALDDEHRHLNTIRALVEIGRTNGESLNEAELVNIDFQQLDGSMRTAILPALSFTKEPL